MGRDGEGDAVPAAGRHRYRLAWRVRLRRLLRAPVLAAGGGATAAAGVAVAVGLGAGAAPACAAPPVAGTEYEGQATHYQLESGGGNCSYPGPPADGLYAALSPAEYDAAAACGGYLDVTGPGGTVRVKVVDQCPECATGHIDLSRDAFTRIADLATGIVPVTYQMVSDPPLPRPLGFLLKDGVSQFWFAVLVLDHGNPLAAVESRAADGGWRSLERQDFNYWIAEAGLGAGPYELRVTDVAGHRVTVPGVQLAPEQLQTSEVSMYAGGESASRPAPRSPSPSTAPSLPAPAPSASATATQPAAAAASTGTPSPAPGCR